MSEKPVYYVYDVAIHYLNEHCHEIALKGPEYGALCAAARNMDVAYFDQHLEDLFVLPFEGKTYAFYRDYCRHVFETTINPLKKRPLKELIFRPMIELIDLLHERDFNVYVVSGSLQFSIMAISEKYLHVDESRCIGSMVAATAEREGKKTIFKRGELSPPTNLSEGKAIRTMMRTGQAPVLAIGNSEGDAWMLSFTASSPYRYWVLGTGYWVLVRGSGFDQEPVSEKIVGDELQQAWVLLPKFPVSSFQFHNPITVP